MIGVCFMFCVESFQRSKIYKKATKKLGIPKNKIQLNNLSRIAGVLIWPAGLVVFFIYRIRYEIYFASPNFTALEVEVLLLSQILFLIWDYQQ